MRLMLVAVVLVLGIGAQATFAQQSEQSPTNAHTFLMNVTLKSAVLIEPPDHKFREEYYSPRFQVEGYCDRKNRDRCMDPVFTTSETPGHNILIPMVIKSSNGCMTMLDGKPPLVARETKPSGRTGYPSSTTIYLGKPFLDVIYDQGIDWSRVTKIETREGTGLLEIQSQALQGRSIRLRFVSSEFAERTALALEVIRQSCDPLAKEAF